MSQGRELSLDKTAQDIRMVLDSSESKKNSRLIFR